MKKTIVILLSLVLMFAFTAVTFAAEKEAATAETKAAAKKAVKKQVTGEVAAIDAKAKTITVAKKVKDKVEETVISVDDKMLADVKQGDKVTVKFMVTDGKNVAKSVKKAVAKAEKKAAPEKKEAAPAKKAAGY
jgi:Cu/Ag efflux protein CusF